MAHSLLVVIAVACEILASTNLVGDPPRTRIIAAGLAFFMASFVSW